MPCPFILRSAAVEQYKEDIAASVAQLFEGIDGTVESGPVAVTVGGLPGYRLEAANSTPRGERVHTRFFQLCDGTTATSSPVQWMPEVAEEVGQGCEQIQSTFSLE
jgi:hypothetical protein